MLDLERLKADGISVWGYVRVSTKDQKLDRQIDAMLEYGVPESHIWEDKETGKTFNRPEYKKMIRVAQRGDIIVIKSIDRLGRNYSEIRDQWQLITQDIGCGIHVIDMPALNTTGNPGDLMSRFVTDMILQVLAFVAQNERETTLKRQKEGIKSAKKKGTYHCGRNRVKMPFEFWELFILWKSKEIRTKEIEQLCKDRYGMSTRTFYRRMEELNHRYGDIPPEQLREYVVEDDFRCGIEFSYDQASDIMGPFKDYIPPEVDKSSDVDQAKLEEEAIKQIVLEKRRAEFRRIFGLDNDALRYTKHAKVAAIPHTKQVRDVLNDAEISSLAANIKTIIVD